MSQTSITTGGYLKDIPKPHIRMWPDTTGHGLQRCFDIQVSRYEMSAVKHYHISWSQEDNPLQDLRTHAEANPQWEEIQNTTYGKTVIGWRCCWDDEERKGLTGHNHKSTTKLAAMAIVREVAARFPDHEIKVNYMKLDEWLADMLIGGPDQHYYKREGD